MQQNMSQSGSYCDQSGSYCEKLSREPGSSLSRLNRQLEAGIPFQWHHHPEYELTLTLNSRGQRFIGDHVGAYDDGDLVLIGPNLPHTWCSREKIATEKPHIALVVWFQSDWTERLTQDCVEFSSIQSLLLRARRGVHFSRSAASAVRSKLESLFSCPATERLLIFLGILHRLANAKAEDLASHGPLPTALQESRERIDRILGHMHANYAEPVNLTELAEIAALSQSGLHRLFVKHTGKTISDYLAALRIGDACARLNGTTQPVNFIADEVGYPSLANFNRQFRALKGMTPREYRNRFIR